MLIAAAQLPGLCLLRTRNRERTLEMRLGLGRVWLWRLERDFSGLTSASNHLSPVVSTALIASPMPKRWRPH
jgi:hypothetical protein